MKIQKGHPRSVSDANVTTENCDAAPITWYATSSVGHRMGAGILLTKLVCFRLTTKEKEGVEGKHSPNPSSTEGFLGEKCRCAWPFRHIRKLITSDDAATYSHLPPLPNESDLFHSRAAFPWSLRHRMAHVDPKQTPCLLGFDKTLGVVCSAPTLSPGPMVWGISAQRAPSSCYCHRVLDRTSA